MSTHFTDAFSGWGSASSSLRVYQSHHSGWSTIGRENRRIISHGPVISHRAQLRSSVSSADQAEAQGSNAYSHMKPRHFVDLFPKRKSPFGIHPSLTKKYFAQPASGGRITAAPHWHDHLLPTILQVQQFASTVRMPRFCSHLGLT